MAECKDIEVYKPPDLNSRLEEEKDMLEKYFWPEKYPILHKDDTPCFEREVKLKEGRNYTLRVYVNSTYPDQLPDLVVCESPEPMPVNSREWGCYRGSHKTHTWPPLHGFLHICHWHWVAWTRENMIYQVFNKGAEWLEAYEKYLVNYKLPLELDQMKLTKEEELKEQRVEKFQTNLALCQLHPNFLNVLHHWHMHEIFSNILSQRNLPIILPITVSVGEIRNAQRQMIESLVGRLNMDDSNDFALASLFALQCVITECKLANPGCEEINVSRELSDDGQFHFSATAVGPRSIKNN